MCAVPLPPGVKPIAIDKFIIYHIASHHITSYHSVEEQMAKTDLLESEGGASGAQSR